MKQVLLLLVVFVALFSSCRVFKKHSKPADPLLQLEGEWNLNFISGPRIAFDGLYPEKKPEIRFDIAEHRMSGFAGCNSFNGSFNASKYHISFANEIALSRMICTNMQGESTFMDLLRSIDNWSVQGNLLYLNAGPVMMMRFERK
jgi:heat shock protein HslJ